MRPISFRENYLYSQEEITRRFDEFLSNRNDIEHDSKSTDNAFRKLRESGIIKVRRQNNELEELDDEMDNDDAFDITEANGDKQRFSFRFVGVIVVLGFVIVVYPKYFEYKNDECDEAGMKRVSAVIEKYKKSQKQSTFKAFDESQPVSYSNLLSIELYILSDYWENGFYSNEHTVFERNGNGEIHWEKTINNECAVLINNRPIYVDLQTT